MTKYPTTPEEILPELVQDYQKHFGQELVAVVLYGSAARGTYVPKKSDINIMVVLTAAGIAAIAKAFPLMKKWQASAVAIPLVLTEEYIKSSVDSFPIEFLNLKNNYRVLYGQDVLASVTIPRDMLRLQCEAQIKGKLLHLRGEFLATLGEGAKIKQLLAASVPAFAAVFNGLLMLKGLAPPQERGKVFRQIAETYGLDASLLERIYSMYDSPAKPGDEELVQLGEHYIAEIRKLAFTVDQIK